MTERFWAKVRVGEHCWEWSGPLFQPTGYGAFWLNRQNRGAHRVSWMLHNKADIPAGMQVCHRCDNRKCVNPEHLFLGTGGDNLRDMFSKGRHGRKKLNPANAREIVAAVSAGESQVSVASRFGISAPFVSNIVNGRSWKSAMVPCAV